MSNVKHLPTAALGAAAEATRKAAEKLDTIKSERIDPLIEESAEEGRKVVGRIPGAARVLGAADQDPDSIAEMPGIGRREVTRLRSAGIRTVEDLWMHAGDRAGRQDLAGLTGIDEQRLATWAKRADLMQVKAIGPRYAALLDLAGVSSLKQLRRRNPASLRTSLEEANRTHRVVSRLPGEEELADWIEKADLIVAS